ncbi:cytochrome c oxidase subunit 1 [Geranomyces michiganensis]|nr:cytochrome c oxidase subunit 1 [Geranomyces michiganensis]
MEHLPSQTQTIDEPQPPPQPPEPSPPQIFPAALPAPSANPAPAAIETSLSLAGINVSAVRDPVHTDTTLQAEGAELSAPHLHQLEHSAELSSVQGPPPSDLQAIGSSKPAVSTHSLDPAPSKDFSTADATANALVVDSAATASLSGDASPPPSKSDGTSLPQIAEISSSPLAGSSADKKISDGPAGSEGTETTSEEVATTTTVNKIMPAQIGQITGFADTTSEELEPLSSSLHTRSMDARRATTVTSAPATTAPAVRRALTVPAMRNAVGSETTENTQDSERQSSADTESSCVTSPNDSVLTSERPSVALTSERPSVALTSERPSVALTSERSSVTTPSERPSVVESQPSHVHFAQSRKSSLDNSDCAAAMPDMNKTSRTSTNPAPTLAAEKRKGAVKGMSLRVLEAYIPSDDAELALEIGDVVELDLTPDTDSEYWWYGTNRSWGPNNGLQGYFPAECVEIETWTIDTAAQRGAENHSEDLSPMTAASWVTAPDGGESDKEDQNSPALDDGNEDEETVGWTPVVGSKVIVKHPYEKTKADELDLIIGDMVVVMEAPEGGWWRGAKNLGGKIPESGWFPSTLVRPAPADEVKTTRPDVSPRAQQGPLSPTKHAIQAPASESEADSTNDRRKSWFQKRIATKAPVTTKKKGSRIRSNSAPATPMAVNSVSGDLEGVSADTSVLSVVTEGSSDIDTAVLEERINSMTGHVRSRSTPPHALDGDTSGGGGASKGLNRLSTFLRGDKDRKSHFSGQSKMTLMESTFDMSSTSPFLHLDDLLLAPTGNERWQERVSAATLAAMSHRAQQRMTAIHELIATERYYVRDLKIIIALFMRPMIEKKVISAKNIDILFSNIEELLTVNSEFLARLEELYATNPVIEQVGDLLATAMERFVSYMPYCSRQVESGVKHISMMQNKREYRLFLEEAYRHPLARRLDLGGFLIKPVQRICKYPLLIREVIKYTDDSLADYESLKIASERLRSIIAIVNAGTKQTEGAAVRKMADVQGDFADKTMIMSGSRHLLREDAIFGIFPEGKKARQLLLFNDAILLAKKDWRDKWHTIALASFQCCLVADVREHTAATATTLLELEFLPDAARVIAERYLISMLSAEAKTAWLDAYRRAAQPVGCSSLIKVQTRAGLLTLESDPLEVTITHSETVDDTSTVAALTAEVAQLRAATEAAVAELAQERELVSGARAELAEQLGQWTTERTGLLAAREQVETDLATTRSALAAAENRIELIQKENAALAATWEESKQQLKRAQHESAEQQAAMALHQASADLAHAREQELRAQIQEAVDARAELDDKLQEMQTVLREREATCTRLQLELTQLRQSAETVETELQKSRKLVEDRDQLLSAKSADAVALSQKIVTLERDAAKNRSRADASRAAAETARATAEAALLREQEIGEIRLRAVQQNLENVEKDRDRAIAGKNAEIAALTQKVSASEQEAMKSRAEALALAQKLATTDTDLMKSRVELAGLAQKLTATEQDLLRARTESSERLKSADDVKASMISELDKLREQRTHDQQMYAESERTRRDLLRELDTGRVQFKSLSETNAQLAADHARQKELLAENKLQLKLFAADKEKLDARLMDQDNALKKASKDVEVLRAAEESGREANRKLQEEAQRMAARAERAEAKIAPMERLTEKVASLTEEIKDLKSRHQELLADLKAKHGETVERLERKTAKLGREKDDLQKFITEIKRGQMEADRALSLAEKEKEKLQRERDDLLRTVTDLKQGHAVSLATTQASYEKEITQLKLFTADKPGGDDRVADRKNALSTAAKEVERLERDKSELQKELADLQRKIALTEEAAAAQKVAQATTQRGHETELAQLKHAADGRIAELTLSLANLEQRSERKVEKLQRDKAGLAKSLEEVTAALSRTKRDLELAKAAEELGMTAVHKLQDEVQRATAKAERAETTIAPMERLQAKLEHLSEEKSKLQELQLEAKRVHANDLNNIQRLERKLDTLDREHSELQRTIGDLRRAKDDSDRAMGCLQNDKAKLEKENLEMAKTVKAAQDAQVQAGMALNSLTKENAVFVKQLEDASKALIDLKQMNIATETAIAAARKEDKKARERIKAFKRELRQNRMENAEANHRYVQCEEQLRATIEDLRHINGALASSEAEAERARSAAGSLAHELSEMRSVYADIAEALESASQGLVTSVISDSNDRLKSVLDDSRGSTFEEPVGSPSNAKEIASRIVKLIWQCDQTRSELKTAQVALVECQEQRDAAIGEAEQIKALYAKTSEKAKKRAIAWEQRAQEVVFENGKLIQQISEQAAKLEQYERERRALHINFQAHKAEHYHAMADINRRTLAITKGFEKLAVSKNDALRKIDEYELRLREGERNCARLQQLATSLQEKQHKTDSALQTANETSRDLVAELARARRQIALLRGETVERPAGESGNALKFLVAAASKDLREAARVRAASLAVPAQMTAT